LFGLLLFGPSWSNAGIRNEVAKGFGKFLSNVCNMVEATPRRFGAGRSLRQFEMFSAMKASPPSRLTIG